MYKQVALTWASALGLLAGAAQTGCTQHDPVAEMAPTTQVAPVVAADGSVDQEKLLAAMAADPVVQDHYRATAAYATQMGAWMDSTPAAEQDAKLKAYDEALARGEDAVEPAHTAAQQHAEEARMERAHQLIHAKYPQLAKLSPEEFGTLYGQLASRLQALPN